jgi:GNAT superfamily N-acetyltransferase
MIHPDRTGQLVRMSVDTKFRRKGIGRAIVNHLLKIGGEHSLERFIVETHRGWDNARKLYQHCGFQIYQEDNESIYLQCFQPTIGHLN